MAKQPNRGRPTSARAKRARPGNLKRRLLATLVLVLLVAGGVGWWKALSWQPDRKDFPVQGVWLSDNNGAVDWRLLRAAGADFAYLTASEGTNVRDTAFANGVAGARSRGMQVGAVHVYDLCAPADAQAANFVTLVPRDKDMLPPAIRIDISSRTCPEVPGEAQMQSELTTFLNQVEKHAEKAVILMVSKSVEKEFHLAARIDRNIWVEQDFLEPAYAGRPWVMWTASSRLRLDAVNTPVRWVVVQP
ncbi:MAG: lysozyme [Novosphingobium sp. 17-62-19]|uniref:glycoside hydrolase family 25 protein n=1 Tax=Novosphingobium sp. 17-62-19 TaxID=1970406 RepID=UPI000BCC7A59|nr:glycoside hydrolase family 25 protein [Novosphingobium sp. 17-62-19]OYX92790.1 MAG: lysozyme [Novosphingobium sp. 35-62-5]OZA19518.1 MAG: lysozyme [Novosphingobium sp. 17-62-19]OZA71929.1 MAG: lysozyme [Sphingomonadales bacterium 39-62-4]HQS97656.1 glycoside hydrolase family 25 protein [Novosphingobium sp.]